MLAPWALVAAVALSVGCRKPHAGSPEDAPTPTERRPEPEVKMTTMDPKSPEAWRQAEAIAATVSGGKLEKRSDALPFLFLAGDSSQVLVHKGKVVKEEGAAAAGRYLRDLGIIDGKGPGIKDVLLVLEALNAWPPVEVPVKSFIHYGDDYVPTPEELKYTAPQPEELTAQITLERDAARVVLHYFLPGPPNRPPPTTPAEDRENDVGSPDESDVKPAIVKPLARAILEIPRSGEPGWKPILKLNWVDERHIWAGKQ
jgi:hypothetical protein